MRRSDQPLAVMAGDRDVDDLARLADADARPA